MRTRTDMRYCSLRSGVLLVVVSQVTHPGGLFRFHFVLQFAMLPIMIFEILLKCALHTASEVLLYSCTPKRDGRVGLLRGFHFEAGKTCEGQVLSLDFASARRKEQEVKVTIEISTMSWIMKLDMLQDDKRNWERSIRTHYKSPSFDFSIAFITRLQHRQIPNALPGLSNQRQSRTARSRRLSRAAWSTDPQ